MTIRELMQTKVTAVRTDTPAKDAYEIMRHGQFRHLPVLDNDGRVVGIVSDRDMLSVAVMFDKHPQSSEDYMIDDSTTVADVMTPNPTTISPDDAVDRAVDLMVKQRISGLPVVDQGKLVGILTETDLLRLLQKLLGNS